jgi:glycogen debranching enzyme
MSRFAPHDLPPYTRRDTVHVAGSQRPNAADYDRFVHLVNLFRQRHYDPVALLAESPFLVQDILTNSILYRADEDLRALGKEIGEPVDEIDAWMKQVAAVFNQRFWNDKAGLYFDYDCRQKAPIEVNTAMTFLPLYAGLADQRQASRLIEKHLLNRSEYGLSDRVHHWLTSTSQGESVWEPRRYWRGPVWIILNWLVAEGLSRYGYSELAGTFRHDSIDLIKQAGFYEYFDAGDGSGCGSDDFSWSAALTIEMLAH